jgi:nitrogen fixation protein NifX
MAMQRQLRVLENAADADPAVALQVAFATSDLKHVDQHFGSAERFAIYRVEAERVTLSRVAEFGALEMDGNENKLLEKFVLLDGCAAVYSQAIGPSAVRQLLGLGIQPMRVPEGSAVSALLAVLQQELAAGAPGWISRALERQRRDRKRFETMAAEGWED